MAIAGRSVVGVGPYEVKSFTTGCLFLAGSVAAVLTMISGWSSPTWSTGLLLGFIATGDLIGAALVLWRRRTQPWALHAASVAASCLVGVAVWLSHSDAAGLAMSGIFVLITINTLFTFTGRQAVLHSLLLEVVIAWSLTARGLDVGTALSVMVVQAAVIVLIGPLVTRAGHSVRDSLTGLPNRRAFDERLDAATATAHRGGVPLSLALIDVDHFKSVNDRGGHAAGDALLQHLAATWTTALPAETWLSRQGGDEFALLIPAACAGELQDLCELVRAAASPSAVSIGVADLGTGEDAASLVRRADAALYAAKTAGRGRTRIADPGDDALRLELAAAVAAEAVDVVLQPIVHPATAELVGVEALARWHHPQRGWVSPAVFVPLAERTAQVGALGRYVLERACRDALALRAALGRDVLLTVNTSGQQLIDPAFLGDLAGVLDRTGWPAAQLVVEVTESTVEIASSTALETLRALRELGVAVAIDDFGTGYSAFSHLDTLPADYLKLDAAFTADITTSSRRAAMLTALLDLCGQLGIVVIAEGVETADHSQLLSELGCPLAQGYHYARPAPVEDLVRDHAAPAPGPVPAAVPAG